MSIIIKGMDMPKDGTFDIINIYSNGCVALTFGGRGMEEDACIIAEQLPPHGRLIDADELIKDRVSNDMVVIHAKCAPTIIEAEGERE